VKKYKRGLVERRKHHNGASRRGNREKNVNYYSEIHLKEGCTFGYSRCKRSLSRENACLKDRKVMSQEPRSGLKSQRPVEEKVPRDCAGLGGERPQAN